MSAVPFVSHTDPRWADYPYGLTTVGADGSALACYCMLAGFFGLNSPPSALAVLAAQQGFSPHEDELCEVLLLTAGKRDGLPLHQSNNSHQVRNALKRGLPCIGVHGPGKFGSKAHFVVYTGLTAGDTVILHDPAASPGQKMSWDLVVDDNARHAGFAAFVPEISAHFAGRFNKK